MLVLLLLQVRVAQKRAISNRVEERIHQQVSSVSQSEQLLMSDAWQLLQHKVEARLQHQNFARRQSVSKRLEGGGKPF